MFNTLVIVDADKLLAASHTASTEEARYYLNGVFVQRRDAGGAHLVATNGKVMAVWRDTAALVGANAKDVIVALTPKRELAKRIAAERKNYPYVSEWYIAIDTATGAWTLMTGGLDVVYHNPLESSILVGGSFPAWDRVLPARDAAYVSSCVSIDAALVAQIALAGHLASDDKKVARAVTFDVKDAGAPIRCYTRHEDFLGVIMPMSRGTPVPAVSAEN